MAYSRVLIQKAHGTVVDTAKEYGVYAVEIPFKVYSGIKEPYSNDWKDEDGKDVYLPENPPLKSYDMDCKFAFRGLRDEAVDKISGFISFLHMGGMFKIYNEHNGVGRQDVYYKDYADDAYWKDYTETSNGTKVDMVTVLFTIKLEVTDPRTLITLSTDV